MEILLNSEFWLDQVTSAFKAWAILVPLILIFFATFKIKNTRKIRGLTEYAEAVESRLHLARELNAGEAKAIAEIRTELDGLRRLNAVNTETGFIEPIIKEVDASAATLATANITTNHILTSENLAIGDVEEKHKLKLVLRPS